ncbi:MAG: biotin/lipoyl-binding protein [Alphaproteobacteria bacterium]|nr:biotin/lipoyl-binding protein [Alphaproteobacteria bacterium]
MSFERVLVANRGEIAIRVIRAANEAGLGAVAVYSADDAASLHTRMADDAVALSGTGAAAYLDGAGLIAAAKQAGCDAVHPGYGFLSENAGFARACVDAGLCFIGPAPETLDLFGDKGAARALAEGAGVPILPGTKASTSLDDAHSFLASLGKGGAVMIKAAAGGGGRGMRPVTDADDLAAAYEICQSEAQAAFGNGDLYLERYLPRARHIEVQIAGDGTGAVCHFGERDCSIQRRHQKIIEIAPAPNLSGDLRERLTDAALKLAAKAQYRNVGTVEFLVAEDDFFFVEANARLQVEHTVTEAVTGADLVRLQFDLANGASLASLGLDKPSASEPRGFAVQARVNMETMGEDGSVRPSGGRLATFEIPSGPGIRVDTFGYAGYQTSPNFDSLLAKVIVHGTGRDFADAARKTVRALSEFKIEGVSTNVPFLQAVLRHDSFVGGDTHTGFLDAEMPAFVNGETVKKRYFEAEQKSSAPRLDASDPLAILEHGRSAAASDSGEAAPATAPDGTVPIAAPMLGTIVSVTVQEGDTVHRGQQILIMEAMKMQHVVASDVNGYLRRIAVTEGETVMEGQALAFVEEAEIDGPDVAAAEEIDLDEIRPDLAEVNERQGLTQDAQRPRAVARRRKTKQRTARENVEDLCDPGSFAEYGSLVLAARRQKHSIEDLTKRTPADGLITGLGRVNGDLFADEDARCLIMSYDYTVLAGTQGKMNHKKKDRMFELAEKWQLPIVFFAEGGGGRPGDTDVPFAANLHTPAFNLFARLSGLAPLVGITSGRCFAGNAVILGCCDVVIATMNSTIGMGGPAMIEGGGLGVFTPEEVGPVSVQSPNGVIDVVVEDEEEAVAVTKQYLSYFQGAVEEWDCPDQRLLRRAIPEDRLRIYDVRTVIDTMADTGSVLELRKEFGLGMVTALVRIEGRPVGIVANNPVHLAGAIDSDGSDKAARFMQLCDAYDIPLVFLCDTPGNMVGPEEEKTALVRHCCRVNIIGANVTVPTFTIVLRKGYGLGAQAMAGGGFHSPFFAISWPTGEFGGMGLEGAIKLGFRDELMAIEDPDERMARYEELVAGMYAQGKAINAASLFELDNVIDPADTREWIMSGLRAAPPVPKRQGKKRPWIDTW